MVHLSSIQLSYFQSNDLFKSIRNFTFCYSNSQFTWPYHVTGSALSVVGPSVSLVRRSGIEADRISFSVPKKGDFLFLGRKRHMFSRYFYFSVRTVVFSAVNGNEKMNEAVSAVQLSDNKHQGCVSVKWFTICRLFPNGTCLVLRAGHQYRTSKNMNRLPPGYDTAIRPFAYK